MNSDGATAKEIDALLAIKHSKDVYVPECKDGPTMGTSHVRLDGWAMNKSWSNACITGYEIKVSRGDFLKDEKWSAYLPLCNKLYFVCPYGLIAPEELQPEVGLMWVSKNATRLYTKRKAVFRDVEIPESVWRYILMCRAVITREFVPQSKKDYWLEWLKHKRVGSDLGYKVGKRLAKRINEEVVKAREENERLQKLIIEYEDIRNLLEEIGIDPKNSFRVSRYSVEREIKQKLNNAPPDLINTLRKVAEDAAKAAEILAPYQETANETN